MDIQALAFDTGGTALESHIGLVARTAWSARVISLKSVIPFLFQ